MRRRLHFEFRYLFDRIPWDSGVSPPELLDFLKSHPPGEALELGCGTGTNAITMAKHGWRVTAIDISARAIRRSKRRAEAAELEIDFRRGDVTRLIGIEGPFDMALDIGCFHTLSATDRSRYSASLTRAVRPDGVFLLYSFLGSSGGEATRWPSEEEIRRHFGVDFELASVEYGEHRGRPSAWFIWHGKGP